VYRSGPYSGFGTRALLDSKVYNAIYRIILFLVVQYILPMMLLVILNARVVVALRHATVHRANTLRVESLVSAPQSHARFAVTSLRVTRFTQSETDTVRRDSVNVRFNSSSDIYCRRRCSTVYYMSPSCYGSAGAVVTGSGI